MNQNIITGDQLIELMPDFKATRTEIKNFGKWHRVEKFFIKHNIRPFYSEKGTPFTTIQVLTESTKVKLDFGDA